MQCQEIHLIFLSLISNKKPRSDWHNQFSVSRKKGTPLTKSHTVSFHVASLFHQMTHVNMSSLMHSLHICPCTCNVQGISADSMAEYMLLFLMLLVLKNIKTTIIMARFKMLIERMFPANMSARFTMFIKTTEWYADDHLFYLANAQRWVHKILPLCAFWFRGYRLICQSGLCSLLLIN